MIITDNITALAIVIPLMAVLLFMGLWSFRLFFSYKITDKNITVNLFHILPIYRISFAKIVEMHTAPVHEVALIPGVHLFTRPFARRVVIEMKDTWTFLRFAFLTPDNPDVFIAEIKKRLPAST